MRTEVRLAIVGCVEGFFTFIMYTSDAVQVIYELASSRLCQATILSCLHSVALLRRCAILALYWLGYYELWMYMVLEFGSIAVAVCTPSKMPCARNRRCFLSSNPSYP
jgi:hypothetical protein